MTSHQDQTITISSGHPDHGNDLEIERNEFSSCHDQSTTNIDIDHAHPQGEESGEVPTPRIWAESYSSTVMACLLVAIGLLVMCVPFLPLRNISDYSFVSDLIVIRNTVLAIFVTLSLVVMIWLTRRVVELHDKGVVLWPRRCKHCAFALMQIKLYEKAVEKRQTFKLDKMSEIPLENIKTGQVPTVNKVTVNIVYIFSGLGFVFIITTLINTYSCFNEHSASSPNNATNTELITLFILNLCIFVVFYCISFHFIPNYCDAYIVAVPQIRLSFVLFCEVGIWLCIERLVRPFGYVTFSQHRNMYLCSTNTSAGDFMKGILEISQPFSVELPLMITWMFIEMWSHFLPRHAHAIMKRIHKENENNSLIDQGLVRHSNWNNLRHLFYRLSRSRIRKSNRYDYTFLQRDTNLGALVPSDGITNNENIEMLPVESHEGSRCRNYINVSSRQNTCNKELKRALSNDMEKALAVTILICVVYFGLSKLVLAGQSIKIRGRYLQWLLRMTFFIPMIMIIVRHRKLIRGADGSHVVRLEGATAQENNKMLLITLTGALLYETACFVSSFGNLCNMTVLSHDQIALNVVSILASLFGVIRKYYQSVFLLCVQRLQPKDEHEMKWTLLCLIVVGMTNVTQWMFDSLVHEVGSSVALPVLSMFFDGNVGQVIGMLVVPFLHLYELHVAIIAYEMYKVMWSL